MAFQTDPLINLVIAGLIITGGLGFMVWFDLATQFDKKKKRRLRFHTKLVLFLTAGILLFGTVSTLFTGVAQSRNYWQSQRSRESAG